MSTEGESPGWLGRLPPERRRWLIQHARRVLAPAWLGTLRRVTPVSRHWGFDRGTPVDRGYIARFLTEHRLDIRGRVLEVQDRGYTERFGTNVERSDVLDIDPANSLATIVADLGAADGVPSDTFDCFILTQTLHLIYDTRAAIAHAHRLLRAGGVLLVTVPAVSRLARRPGAYEDYWRFTPAACARLFGDRFGPERVTVRAYGNVLTAIAFLTGMAREELSRRQFETDDPWFPVLVTVRAVKA